MHSIKLADGTLLENLELNGNNYISNTVIEDSVFGGNLEVVEISDGETTETHQDMKLMSNIVRNGKSWIVLGQKSTEEIEKETLLSKIEELNRIVAATGKASQIATKDMIKADELTPEQIVELVELYPKYGVGVDYMVGDLFQYEGELIEVIQSHTSQADWDPLKTVSIYKIKTPYAVIGEWVQPTGAHDAYNTGDKVLFEGKTYESTIDGNVWSPTGYPAGWSLING